MLLRGYLRTPALVPVKDVSTLRQALEDCRAECAGLRAQLANARDEIKDVRAELRDVKDNLQAALRRIDDLLRDNEWWRERWRKTQEIVDSRKG